MIKRHIVEITEELDKDGKVVSRTTTTTDETDDNYYGGYCSTTTPRKSDSVTIQEGPYYSV